MDDFDRKLIALLRTNARMPLAVMADILGKSRGTVQNRLNKLIEDGTIVNFTITVKPGADPTRVRAIMMLAVEGEKSATILKTLQGFPEVTAIHTTNGRWDLVVELAVDTLESFDKVLHHVRKIKGIASSETNLLLSTYPMKSTPPSRS